MSFKKRNSSANTRAYDNKGVSANESLWTQFSLTACQVPSHLQHSELETAHDEGKWPVLLQSEVQHKRRRCTA